MPPVVPVTPVVPVKPVGPVKPANSADVPQTVCFEMFLLRVIGSLGSTQRHRKRCLFKKGT